LSVSLKGFCVTGFCVRYSYELAVTGDEVAVKATWTDYGV